MSSERSAPEHRPARVFLHDRTVRRAAMMHEVPCITTLTGAAAAVSAIRALRQQGLGVRALQDYYAGITTQNV